jgi:uncharacterized damage-inducible protein DinB
MLWERLETAFRGSRYHSFIASLKGVREEEARREPPHYRGFAHMTGSILNLAYHVAGDKAVLISHAFGDGSVTWEHVRARFDALGGDLAAARALAEEGHAQVLDMLSQQTDASLDAPRPYYGGKTLTAYEIFAIIAEHDLYHAGQINYVRCLYPPAA